MRALIIVLVVLGILGFWLMGSRNTLVTKDEGVRQAWSQVENSYQRRADLIPNLVETVKGAAGFEKETFSDIAEARAKAGQITVSGDVLADPQKFEQFQQAQQRIGAGLGRLLATAEAYPDLKANANFRDLQVQLEGTENRISVERKRFNDAVAEYNLSVKRFPANVVAGMFGFAPKPYFQADEGAKQAPSVKF
jgi:LemA protein